MGEQSQNTEDDEVVSATPEEIEEWEEEHDEPHPVFVVNHRPERVSMDEESDDMEDQTELGDFGDQE